MSLRRQLVMHAAAGAADITASAAVTYLEAGIRSGRTPR